MKLDVWGSVVGSSGYANHTRELIIALAELGVDVRYEGPRDDNKLINSVPTEKFEVLKTVLDKKPHFHEADHTLMINIPHYWPYKFGDRLNLHAYLVYEGDRLPLYLKKIVTDDRINKIFYPSLTVEKILPTTTRSFHDKYVHVPHGVDPRVFSNDRKPLKLPDDLKDHYCFVFVGGWTHGIRDRKGLDFALKAFDEEFSKDDKVLFFAKLNPSYGFSVKPQSEISKIGLKPTNERPPIIIVQDDFDWMQMSQLYNLKGCLVNPSKCEGFGLNVFEALCSGMPVVSMNTGYVENLNQPENVGVYAVDYEGLSPATGGWFYDGVNWGVPSVKALRYGMREVYENHKVWKAKALRGSKWIKSNLTWQHVANKLLLSL